jgi:serine/threonine protein kinase
MYRFLHDTLKPHVVHGDVRASNVLLDEQFDAHILGVGGRKVALRESTSGHTIAGGTYGYLAPEFVYRNEVTIKSDVYSFGVLLLELITGRKPIVEVDTPDWQSLFEWATPLVQSQHFIELLDPLIVTIPDSSQVQAVVDLVYSCTQHVPGMRPRMSHVVHQLQQLQQGLVPPPQDMNKVISGHNISSLELEIAEVPL